eukprot:scaffold17264_cov25-Tisochrysis_lutea.AAC.1
MCDMCKSCGLTTSAHVLATVWAMLSARPTCCACFASVAVCAACASHADGPPVPWAGNGVGHANHISTFLLCLICNSPSRLGLATVRAMSITRPTCLFRKCGRACKPCGWITSAHGLNSGGHAFLKGQSVQAMRMDHLCPNPFPKRQRVQAMRMDHLCPNLFLKRQRVQTMQMDHHYPWTGNSGGHAFLKANLKCLLFRSVLCADVIILGISARDNS